MSRIAKLALILVIAVIAIGAKHVVSPERRDLAQEASMRRAQVSPEEIMRASGVLPATKVDSYEWVDPLP